MTASRTSAAALTIRLFCPMQTLVHGRPLLSMHSRKGLWLLALLTLRHSKPVERAWLAGTLWPDCEPSLAFANLRRILSELRARLGDQSERIQAPDRHTLLLDLHGADVDVVAFDAAIKSEKRTDLEQAVGLYCGPLLEGCQEEWAFQERNVREHQCLAALQKLGAATLTEGDSAQAISYYQRAVGLDPWCEAAQRGWMEALSKNGDTNAALQVYRQFVELLRNDPTATPDAQTSALYRRLRAEARRRAGTRAAVPAEAVAAPVVKGYLPHPLTDLVGREDERIEVALLLRRSRLVTLTGMGGIGKTRLAREVAGEVVGEYADGVWMVALEALSEGRLVALQIASALGLKEEPGRTLLQSVTAHLRTRRLLLVLDNCEHLLEASVQVAVHLLQECGEVRILATSREALGLTGETAWAVPALTAPDPAHLPQSQATLVRVLMSYESVQLFVERAQAVQKTFLLTKSNARMVAEVCSRLEGIPLALELAAARIKAMTVEQIAARLNHELDLLTWGSRTAQSRQQTLRGTLDWSYALLTRPEQVLLNRVSVFAGGWTLEAAEAVCVGSEIEAREVLNVLTALVDKSLVVCESRQQEGERRYRLLEVVRQYAGEKLEASAETHEIDTKHRDWFVALAEQSDPALKGTEQKVWIERLVTEYDNLRMAMARCGEDAAGIEAGLRITAALWQFWTIRGDHFEGRRQLEAALARDRTQLPTRERAKALQGLGFLLERQGEYPGAQEYQEQALRIREQIDDRRGVGASLFALGNAAIMRGDYDTGRAFYERSIAIRKEFEDRHGIAVTGNNLGWIALRRSDYVEGKSRYEESLATFRELGDKARVAWGLTNLGIIAFDCGDYVLAQRYQEESLPLFEELGDKRGKAWALYVLAGVDYARMRYDAAQTRYQESLSLYQECGDRDGMARTSCQRGTVAIDQGDPEAAHAWLTEGLRLYREVGDKTGIANALEGLGVLACQAGDFTSARALLEESLRDLREASERHGVMACLETWAVLRQEQSEMEAAVCLLGAAHRLRENIGLPATPNRQAKLDALMEQARTILGISAFAAAWEEGHNMTWEQAVAFALEEAPSE